MPRRSSNALRELLEARELIRDKVPDGWFAYPVSRAEAVEQGLKYYFTGEPCSQKHISLRAVNGRNCLECKGYKTIPPPEENLTSDGRNTGGYRHYTSEEDEYLKSNYKIKSKKEMSRELGRSVKSIEKHLLTVLELKIDYQTRDATRISENKLRNHALRESHRGNVPNEWFGLPASRGEAEQKKADYYFTGDACDRGHIDIRGGNHHRCLQCCRDDALVNNKTEERKVWKRSYNKRPEVRQRENAYVQNRFRNDSTFRFRVNVSSRIANFFARRKSAGKAEITEKLLGCSCKEFRKWIEDQMDDYMTLDNYGREGWHLDHWRPIMGFKEFDIEVEREVQLVAFNWRNYQPLRGDENLSKNDNWDEKMEAEWTERMRSLGWKGELFLCFAKDP